jgi:hypothetical protein
MDTLSEKSPNQGEKSPNQGENPHDEKMMMDLVEPSSHSLVRPLNCLSSTSDILESDASNSDCSKPTDQVSAEVENVKSETLTETTSENSESGAKLEHSVDDRLSPVVEESPVEVSSKFDESHTVKVENFEIAENVAVLNESTKVEEEEKATVDLKTEEKPSIKIEDNIDSTNNSDSGLTNVIIEEVEVPKNEENVIDVSAVTAITTLTTNDASDDVTLSLTENAIPVEIEPCASEEQNKLANAFLTSKSASVWLNSDSTTITEVTTPTQQNVVIANAVVVADQPTPQQTTLTKMEPAAFTSVLNTATGLTLQSSTLRRSPAPPTTTSTMNGGYTSAGLQSMRSALNVPAGAKMVPVKLVSVSGEGNVRLVRVSPVKSSLHNSNDGTSVLSPRTVVIKSSMLKTVAPKAVSVTATNTTPLPAHLANSQPLSPSLLNNVCKESTAPGLPTSVYNLINSASETNLKSIVVTSPVSNCTGPSLPASVLGNLELLPPQQQPTKDKMESFSISAEMKEKLLSTSTATLLATPMLGPSLSITPVWSQMAPNPASTTLSSNLSLKEVVVDKNSSTKVAVNDAATAFALRTLEPVSLAGPKVELEVDTKSAKGRNRPQKKSPLTLNSDFGGSLLRPLLQKEDPVNEVKAKPRPKAETEAAKSAGETIQPNSTGLKNSEPEIGPETNSKGVIL